MNTILIRRGVLAAMLSGGVITTTHAADDATDTLVNIDLPTGLVSEVQEALPESQDVNQVYLNTEYNPNITFQDDAHVAVTFLDEGAGYRNSLGYFTFSDSTFSNVTFGQIDTNSNGHVGINELQAVQGVDTSLIFANASEAGGGGSLVPGDTVVLGGAQITNVNGTNFEMTGGETFSEGSQMGFFLMQNAYMGSFRGTDYVKGIDTSSDPLVMYTVDFLNPENSAGATVDTPATYSRHVAMMNSLSAENDIIIGFEDLVRPGGDNDFNDAVFRIRTDPVEALYADVPTTETVISLQAAPVPGAGKGLGGMGIMAFGLLLMYRRKHCKQPA